MKPSAGLRITDVRDGCVRGSVCFPAGVASSRPYLVSRGLYSRYGVILWSVVSTETPPYAVTATRHAVPLRVILCSAVPTETRPRAPTHPPMGIAMRRYRDTARRAATGNSLLRCPHRNTPPRNHAHPPMRIAMRRYRDTARRAATGNSLLRCHDRNTPTRPHAPAHGHRHTPLPRHGTPCRYG